MAVPMKVGHAGKQPREFQVVSNLQNIQEVQVLTSSQNTTSTQIWIVYWIWEAQHVEKLKGNSYVLSFYRSLQDIYDSRN